MKNIKKHQNKKLAIAVIVVFAGLCAFSAAKPVLAMANPAAVYCKDLGYEYIVEKTSDGEFGFCKLPDGSKVEEWKFFSGEEKKEYNYCGKNGYETKTVSDQRCKYVSKCAVCVLENGAEKEVTQLMELKVPKANYSKPIMPVAPAETTKSASSGEDNAIYYFVVIAIAVVLSIAAFVVYKKTKNKEQ